MTFTEFCEAHGIIIDRPPKLGEWERYATKSHPRKRNGAVKWMGDHGFVQDHAIHTEVQFWKPDTPVKINPRELQQVIKQAAIERQRLQENAAMRASMIVNRCVIGRHDYLRKKGFPDERALVWCHDQTEHMIVPMYDEKNHLVGVQTIDAHGVKKFLYGQKTSGANFVMGRGDVTILCEGYATGLSVREAARALKCAVRVVVCFSAHNLPKAAKWAGHGVVIADHDKSGAGEKAAKATGWPFWMSEVQGEDFNDYHRREGLYRAAQSLGGLLYPGRGGGVGAQHSLVDAIRARKLRQKGHPSIEGG